MENRTETLALRKVSVLTFAILLGIATAAPLVNNQFISGSLVNATLLLAVAMLGMRDGLLIGLIPSSVALATGLLPAALAPMIPFIIVGNAILVMVFGYLRNRNYWLGALTGAVLKFSFLWATSSIVAGLVLNEQVASKAAVMMSWPQLVTAVAGSVIAFGFLHFVKKPANNG